jgi:hypothetical protein
VFYIIFILVRFTNTNLFVMALIGNVLGYPQCDIRNRKDNVTRTLKGTKSLHPLPGVTLCDNTFLTVINPSNLWISYSKILLHINLHGIKFQNTNCLVELMVQLFSVFYFFSVLQYFLIIVSFPRFCFPLIQF